MKILCLYHPRTRYDLQDSVLLRYTKFDTSGVQFYIRTLWTTIPRLEQWMRDQLEENLLSLMLESRDGAILEKPLCAIGADEAIEWMLTQGFVFCSQPDCSLCQKKVDMIDS